MTTTMILDNATEAQIEAAKAQVIAEFALTFDADGEITTEGWTMEDYADAVARVIAGL